VVQQEMEFYRPLSPSEVCPGKEGEAEGNGCAVKREQFVFESKLVFPRCCLFTGIKGLVEEVPEHFPGSMGIGVGESRFLGGLAHVQMAEFTCAAG